MVIRRLWDKKDDTALRSCCTNEMSCAEIAVRLNRTVYAIYGRIQKLGLQKPRKCKHSVWTIPRVSLFSELWRAGIPVSEIARELDVTREAIESSRKRFGLAPRPRYGVGTKRLTTPMHRLFDQYVDRDFHLTEEDFMDLVTSPCVVCRRVASCNITAPSQCKTKGYHPSWPYNTIDRINSHLGYFRFNCIPMCWLHNMMKSNLTDQEFRFGLGFAFNCQMR